MLSDTGAISQIMLYLHHSEVLWTWVVVMCTLCQNNLDSYKRNQNIAGWFNHTMCVYAAIIPTNKIN